MRIAIDARPIRWALGTGIGNYTYFLIKSLNHLGARHRFSFLWPDDDLSALPFHGHYTHCAVGKVDRDEEKLIPLWLKAQKSEVFHLPQNGIRFPKEKSIPVIVTLHDLIPYLIPEMVRRSYLLRFLDEMPMIVERADLIVTVSECARQDVIRLFGVRPDKIRVVPSAPDHRYRPRRKDECGRYVREKYGIQYPYILYVGGLNPRKNVAQLIWAYRLVRHELPGLHQLVIPGEPGRHQEDLAALTRQLHLEEDIVFPGFVDQRDIPFLYNAADLFVYPSLYEGFGLPPIEAMASGVPVITSNTSSLPEVTGDAALKVHPMDTHGLAEMIYHILTDEALRSDLVIKGLQKAKEYRWTKIGKQFLEIYELFSS
ncbi:MAG TPA: glycosyltransferase family 1 protein [Bacillota bacterium]|nr:glycosyltransferase family 1 protein [Bacillota bacterium]